MNSRFYSCPVEKLDNRPGVGLRAGGLPDIEWIEIPGGACQIGGDVGAYQGLRTQEVEIPTFWMAKYPITNWQWGAFVANGGYEELRWWEGLEKQEQTRATWSYLNHPREGVSWYEAMAFCQWLSSRLGYKVRLPTEEEWEKAARGREGLIYPWGNEYKRGYSNIDETNRFGTEIEVGPFCLGQTSAVGIYPQAISPYGLEDMGGNVWEWTLTVIGKGRRVLRGGSWYSRPRNARAASRHHDLPYLRDYSWGFRVVTDVYPGPLW